LPVRQADSSGLLIAKPPIRDIVCSPAASHEACTTQHVNGRGTVYCILCRAPTSQMVAFGGHGSIKLAPPKLEIDLAPAQPQLVPIFQLVWLRLCFSPCHTEKLELQPCRMFPSSCEHDRAPASVRLFTRLRYARKSAEWEVCTKVYCTALSNYKIRLQDVLVEAYWSHNLLPWLLHIIAFDLFML